MLVLSRKPGQRIVIGDEITVTVVEVRGKRVTLGFAGPKNIPIYRQEVFEQAAPAPMQLAECM